MKKFTLLFLALSLLLALTVFASSPTVYVTIANGELVLQRKAVTMTDADNDGALTINDALILAHESPDDYAYVNTEYGLSMTKLWGVENNMGYGYYLNNSTTMSLSDTIKNNDEIYAFVYTDTETFSDVFCFFDKNTVSAVAGETISLTLMQAAFDESWNFAPKPLGGANITVNGEVAATTDENGKFTLKLDETGNYVLSASAENMIITPPCANITVNEVPQTGDSFVYCALAVCCCALTLFLYFKKKCVD